MKKKVAQKNPHTYQGIISVTGRGVGYLETPHTKEDIEIPEGHLNTALNGDTVLVALRPSRGKREQGEVVRVLERTKVDFVGTIEEHERKLFLKADDRRMYTRILLRSAEQKDLDCKALVRLTVWRDPTEYPEGTIVRILGKRGTHSVEMESIVLEQGFTPAFPAKVTEAANIIKKKSSALMAQELPGRRDFRESATFTIDPDDAKDFDDALSYKKLADGTYEIGIHIADVSAYVTEKSAIDEEAQKRGTSVYLVDRTILMLPEILSNDLCSLNPQEDKLAFSAVFTLSPDAAVLTRWFGTTVINSKKRFTYKEAQRGIDTKSGPFSNELCTLNELAYKLRALRQKSGAISFDHDEIKFTLDENGKPLAIEKKEHLDTNLLIEDFMLLANREVAQHFYELSRKTPERNNLFIYRIHDIPDSEKLEELAIFLRAIGYDLKVHKGEISGHEINRLLHEIEGKPEEQLIKTATIRSMAKAIYSTKNIGHFGLAFKYYTHFTSPIRRYPDLMVHRILKGHLSGSPIPPRQFADYERMVMQSSQREIAATIAERDSIKYKQVEYMQSHVGEIFDAIISGISDWGAYVEEMKTKAEGLVHVRSMPGDYYLRRDTYALQGEKTKQRYALGDRVRVKLIKADLQTKTVEWEFV